MAKYRGRFVEDDASDIVVATELLVALLLVFAAAGFMAPSPGLRWLCFAAALGCGVWVWLRRERGLDGRIADVAKRLVSPSASADPPPPPPLAAPRRRRGPGFRFTFGWTFGVLALVIAFGWALFGTMGLVWTLGPLGAVVAIVVVGAARGRAFEDEGDRDFERIRRERLRRRLARTAQGGVSTSLELEGGGPCLHRRDASRQRR